MLQCHKSHYNLGPKGRERKNNLKHFQTHLRHVKKHGDSASCGKGFCGLMKQRTFSPLVTDPTQHYKAWQKHPVLMIHIRQRTINKKNGWIMPNPYGLRKSFPLQEKWNWKEIIQCTKAATEKRRNVEMLVLKCSRSLGYKGSSLWPLAKSSYTWTVLKGGISTLLCWWVLTQKVIQCFKIYF